MIVGGGIIGCAIAAELAADGVDVILCERNELAHGASGRNHGLVFYPQDPVSDPLYRESLAMYRDMAQSHQVNISLDDKPRGFVILVETEDEWNAAEAEAKACEVGGVGVERFDADQLRREEPNVGPQMLGGWFIDDGYRLDPAALTLAFGLLARDRGADLRTHVDVKQVMLDGDRVTGVATDQGLISAPIVVDAAGPWAPKLARTVGADLAITGARGWLLLTRAIPPIANHLLESSGWHLSAGDPGPAEVTVQGYASGELPSAPDIGLLIQQNWTGHVLLGGSRLSSMREDPEGHEVALEIARRAARAVPGLADVALAGVWSGVRPMSRDGLPLIGWLGSVEGFFVCGGHGGQGIMLGGGSGRLAAQMIRGAETYTSPHRFDPMRLSSGL